MTNRFISGERSPAIEILLVSAKKVHPHLVEVPFETRFFPPRFSSDLEETYSTRVPILSGLSSQAARQ